MLIPINYEIGNTEMIEVIDVDSSINDTNTIINLTQEPISVPVPLQIKYPEHWTCFDFAMNYSELHPEWGMVVISDNPRFQGMNHLVNYQVNEDKSLQVISYVKQEDGNYEVNEYIIRGWEYDSDTFDYYHFYIDGEIPTRQYRFLKPNAEQVYNGL